ncbi:MAG: ATP-dependent helicase HrpB [Caulobacterales bacterium]
MLPIESVLPDIKNALARANCAVLAAPPGAGKTTRVPLALLDAPWRGDGKIILLSPRRIAARAAAARMAQALNERVGDTIGFRVRLESRVSAKTRIEIVTEGVFTRMILDDPTLDGVAAVLFDEFHERSLDADLGIALARDAQTGLREDLRILVMSATLDVARISALLGDAPVIASEGRMFPVDVRYRPRDPRGRIEDAAASAVRAALSEEKGSALVFLPGAREIERTAVLLEGVSADVLPLYGALDPRVQDAAIAPAPEGRRKVVLATSIAETSLTIEGVRVVIDSGLARAPRYEPGIGLSRLETVRASQASIEQRKGRAGRLEPGVCIRLWDEGETRALPAFARPEILDADLTSLGLDLLAWGVSDPSSLAWLDPPPRAAWEEAVETLNRLSARDQDGRLTEHGARLARIPLTPRLAHMLIASGEPLLAARIAVLLTEQGLGGRDADIRARLRRFSEERGQRAEAARRLADRLARLAGEGVDKIDVEHAGIVLAKAFPERVAKARGVGRSDFLMASGRAAGVDEANPLARETYVVIADASGRADRANILAAAPISIADIEALFDDEIETRASVTFDAASGAVRGRRVRRLGKITLSEGPLADISASDIEDALRDAVRREGLGILPWDEDALQTRARIAIMQARDDQELWPPMDDAALLKRLYDWLPVKGVKRLSDFDGKIGPALIGLLSYPLRRAMDIEAPAFFETPAGSSLRIDYTAPGGPALDVRVQEMFGVSEHPRVAGGVLTLRLLSPAHRPVQTTVDILSFWRGSYASVRAEMRGRYPKHPWPEDPLSAAPTRRAKPKGT